MPRFFFDSDGGGTDAVQDAVGLLFDTLIDARTHAMRTLPILAEVPLADGEFRTWTASVRDESGTVVCRYILTILADTIGPGSSRVMRPM